MKLREVREVVYKLPLEELATLAQIDPRNLAAIEAGEQQPDAETAQRIAHALGLNGQFIHEFWPAFGQPTSRFWRTIRPHEFAEWLAHSAAAQQRVLGGTADIVNGDELRQHTGYVPHNLAA